MNIGNPVNIKLMSSAYNSMYSPMSTTSSTEINIELYDSLFRKTLMIVGNSINTIYNII